jgi:ABC-type lipoprotein export system ATPase subunit
MTGPGRAPPVVAARALGKSVGSGRAARVLFRDLELEVSEGELVAVIGRSGSGKSTLLHLLGGLDRPDAGAVELEGVRLDRASEAELIDVRRRRVGFVFQFFHLLPELTGLENVLLPARLAGNGAAAADWAGELVERLGVTDAAARLPGSLSGGEQQRLAVARALINRPRLILADEPTGNLDDESGHGVSTMLREIADEGRAVVLVTHDLEAATLADRALHLTGGRLVP